MHAITRLFSEPTSYLHTLFLSVMLANALIWARSASTKVMQGNFVDTLADTLGKFASNNPYPFVKNFLLTVAIPNSTVFGTLTLLGELSVAIALLVGSSMLLFRNGKVIIAAYILGAGLLVAISLNITFGLASGWMSPSSSGINMLMFLIEVIGLGYVYGLLTKRV